MFLDQCKRKGIKIEDLDKGWVPQHKIGEESDDEVIEDDEDYDEDDDEETNEDELFASRPAAPRHEINHEKKDASDDDVVTFKIGGGNKKEESPAAPAVAEKPEMSLADLEALFGPSSTPIEEHKSDAPVAPSVSSMYGDTVSAPSNPSNNLSSPYGTPNRDRIGNALSQAEVGDSSQSITYDKTSTDPGAAASLIGSNGKPKIKLNIKPKSPM